MCVKAGDTGQCSVYVLDLFGKGAGLVFFPHTSSSALNGA